MAMGAPLLNPLSQKIGSAQMIEVLYAALVGAFFTHELDAVKRREWRILPLLRRLPDDLGEPIFIWLHVPLFAIVLWAGLGDPDGAMRVGLAVFAVIHVGLHVLFMSHPAYEFNNPSSWALIILTGLLGLAYLGALYL